MSAKNFCDEFLKQWNEDTRKDARDIVSAYEDNRTWTTYMSDYRDSFLSRVSKRLSLTMVGQFYTLDCVYYDKKTNLLYDPGIYPACLDVIIEHENGEKVEEEMYKLLMFRSPLKVLIFYDYPEDDKTTEKRQNWLQEKLSKLLGMGQKVDACWSESDNTEYLFLVGNQSRAYELPKWRYLIVNRSNFGNVDGSGLLDLSGNL